MIKKNLSLFTLIGLVLGVIFGLVCPDMVPSISFIGTFYISCLKYMVVPVVFTSICVSVFNSRKLKNRLVPMTILVFALMFIATFLLSSLIVTIIDPSRGFAFENVEWTGSTTTIGIGAMLKNLVPTSLIKFLTGSNLFTVILLAFVFGVVCTLFDKGEKVIAFIGKIKGFLFVILEYFMFVSPFAVFSLMASTIVNYGSILLGVGVRYILTAYVCTLAALVIVMIVPVLVICKMSPKTFISKVYKIWLITISTCSSAATLPYTIKTCREEFDVPEDVTDVVVPLGTTIHMCGGAVSFALLGLFCSKLYGVEITAGKYVIMLISALLINMAAPGIPGGGPIIGATYLEILGVPLSFIGFYTGIYKLLDMVYTSLNVTDDIASNVIINYLSGKKKR